MRYKNFLTSKKIISPSVLAATVDTTPLSTAPTLSKRNARGRQFYQAVAHLAGSSVNSFAVTLNLVSGSDTYVLDKVTLLPGEGHVWNEQDYGMDLTSTEYMRLNYVATSTHANDRLHFFIRTRDLV